MDQMVDKNQVKSMYKLYGFKFLEATNDYMIFIYDQGYFKNAEILKFSPIDLSEKKFEMQTIGYSVNETFFLDREQLQNKLFEGFFKVGFYKTKMKKEYQKFKDYQSSLLKTNYEYIRGNYYHDSHLKHDDLIDRILSELNEVGPRLIVLEAAAGYGKTCTVNEIVNEIVEQQDFKKIPLMSELSRNRKAKIFRYVLLDEIDKNFPGLKSELVEEEIYSGKIPLIIDGFDELLIRSHSAIKEEIVDKDFDDISTMLGTIGTMLKGNAKIILTSRKSALLSGDKFFEWLDERENKFSVSRYTLNEPSIKDWIGSEKFSMINNLGNDTNKLMSPVLLAFIRGLPDEEFAKVCGDVEKLLQHYFEKLLDRERERQNLKITIEEQLEIFEDLASYMANNGITSESREQIKNRILMNHWDLLDNSRKLYYGSDKPELESIANTLAGHVLLDRNGFSDQVSFINEFVLGILLGDHIVKNDQELFIDMKFIDLVCTSYAIRETPLKDSLFLKLQKLYGVLLEEEKFSIDLRLKNSLADNYNNLSVNKNIIENFEFGNYLVKDSVFYSCVFSKTVFKKSNFYLVNFIDCIFYECSFENDTSEERNIFFSSCTEQNETYTVLMDVRETDSEELEEDIYEKFEKIVIEQFWPSGRANGQPKRAYRTLFNGVDYLYYPYIEEAINRLKKKEILKREYDVFTIDYRKNKEIMEIKNKIYF